MSVTGRFRDRNHAAQLLCDRLPEFRPNEAVVLALPRGGVPVGAVIAERLSLPLDIVLIRKIGVPGHRELAMGAVSDGGGMEVTVNESIASDLGLTEEEIHEMAVRELPEIERRRQLYCGDRAPIPLKGKTAVVVDDGVATGATARLALKLVRQRQTEHIIFAVPVAPPATIARLSEYADEVVCLHQPERFRSVGSYYSDFTQVDDGTVIELLRDAHMRQVSAAEA